MNRGRKITIVSIIITILALLGLEMWTLTNDHPNDTISEVVQSAAKKWIFIPFLTGFLMGHWFWPLATRRNNNVSK